MEIEDIGRKDLEQPPPEAEPTTAEPTAPVYIRRGDPKQVIELLRKWSEEDDGGEQQETMDALIKGMNESRRGQRLPFPKHLRGKTW